MSAGVRPGDPRRRDAASRFRRQVVLARQRNEAIFELLAVMRDELGASEPPQVRKARHLRAVD